MEISLPLGDNQNVRLRAEEPTVQVYNRFYESNPENTDEQTALIERPALVQLTSAGNSGLGRRLFHQPGFCGGDLFHVSGTDLYRYTMSPARVISKTHITGMIQGTLAPDMCATNGYLFVTDGYTLQYTNGTAPLAAVDISLISGGSGIAFSSIDVFHGYLLAAVAGSDRFYWLQPGSLQFQALDFATAERFPDKILQVRVVGDEFWLLGESSVEVWRATGDVNPFQRVEGRAFNFGVWGGTAVRLKDTSVIVVGSDGTVWQIAGNPSEISTPAIAEKTRNAILSALGG